MLFIPSQTVTLFALGFSMSMLVGILVMLAARLVPAHRNSIWVGVAQTGKFPMGVSIAMAGLIHPVSISALLG